jgi:hypothetical protein
MAYRFTSDQHNNVGRMAHVGRTIDPSGERWKITAAMRSTTDGGRWYLMRKPSTGERKVISSDRLHNLY